MNAYICPSLLINHTKSVG